MLLQTSAQQINEVLFAFFFWLSAFVGLIALVVFVAIGVSVYKLVNAPASTRRSLLWVVLLVTLFSRHSRAESLKVPLSLDLDMPVAASNLLSSNKIALGRRLFFDRRLSRDYSLSCAGCHDPARGFIDGKTTSEEVFRRHGTRNVPTLINRGYGAAFFWDGRVPSPEKQCCNLFRIQSRWT